MNGIVFLTLAEVIDSHNNQIGLYGGTQGVRDHGLLRSALAQPQASFSDQWLHGDLFLMAAAYAYHISRNHPFLDGNKRVALACTLVFLELNDIEIQDPKQKLYKTMLAVAQGKMDKNEFSDLLKRLVVSR